MPSEERVGPIIFSHPVARSQLIEEGEVVTFRSSRRTTGETWWRRSRTGKKQGDVVVSELRAAKPVPANLEPYAHLSGFDSAATWVDAIAEVHDEPDSGWLYRTVARTG